MKVSLNWLSDYVELPTSDPVEIRDALEWLGHEVEGVEVVDPGWSDVVIARVTDIQPHPNADKVRLCQVEYDDQGPIDVVCGAWNFEEGAIVPFAKPGAVLPGGFEIGVREIRGVTSNGMICSERELGLGETHEGILVLDDDTPVGSDLEETVDLPDVVFDLSITPNRPDAMSLRGIARELAAYYDVDWSMPQPELPTIEGTPAVDIDIEDPSGCLRFTVRELRDVEIGPSPLWMRLRLRLAGMRPISNAVDVTNYVMLELGHPLHAFDADRIAGERLVVRRAEAGETLVTLDDVERTLVADDLVICDADGPTSLAGTMGGATSEVGDDTDRILLEAATWDPPTIMWMARRHGLRSEASARFERGVDPHLPLDASARAAQLLCEVSGAKVLSEPIDEVAVEVEPADLELPMSVVVRTLGSGFESEQVADHLRSIGLEVTGDDPLQVTVPSFRPDLERPIDLVEEVARLHGYDRFGETVPRGSSGHLTEPQRRTRAIRSTLAGAGLSEAVHLSFMAVEDLDRFAVPTEHEARDVVRVRNPLREEEGVLRTTLLPGLLGSLRYNASHGMRSGALFEIGRIFFDRVDPERPGIPEQPIRLGYALFGQGGWTDLEGSGRPADAYVATALVRLLADVLDHDDLELRATEAPGFHPGRCAEVLIGGTSIGHAGEIHPETSKAYDLPGRIAAAELDLEPLVAPRPPRQLVSPSVFPPTEFDLAFVVDDAVAARTLLDVTAGAAGDLVESATVFDEYRGFDEARKSLAIRYVLRASDRTLTNEEVAPVRRRMIEAAETAVGAELRGAG